MTAITTTDVTVSEVTFHLSTSGDPLVARCCGCTAPVQASPR
jgi:hypothetical protein